MSEHDKKDVKQASILIQALCAIGLVICVLFSLYKEAAISTFVYAILGGGVLGTDNILKLIKSIFRINNDE